MSASRIPRGAGGPRIALFLQGGWVCRSLDCSHARRIVRMARTVPNGVGGNQVVTAIDDPRVTRARSHVASALMIAEGGRPAEAERRLREALGVLERRRYFAGAARAAATLGSLLRVPARGRPGCVSHPCGLGERHPDAGQALLGEGPGVNRRTSQGGHGHVCGACPPRLAWECPRIGERDVGARGSGTQARLGGLAPSGRAHRGRVRL